MQVHQHSIKELRRRVDRLAQQAEEINNVWQTCVEVLKTAHEQKVSGESMVSQHGTFYRE
jgi:prefoldin subunit 5